MDFLLNGKAHGDVATRLLQYNGDPGALRPWLGKDGQSYVTVMNSEGKPQKILTNAPATLTKDEWELLDQQVMRVYKERLQAWKHLMGMNLRFSIPNGMAKTVLQYQNMSDISDATTSMDGLREGERDRPVYDLVNLPLPIIHKDFKFSLREVMASRTGPNFMSGGPSSPLDLTTATLAARRAAEAVEKLLLGVSVSYAFGGGTVYGYTNFPYRATKTMTAPTGANAAVTLAEVLDMRYMSQQMKHYGPWVLYNSIDWDEYLDNDYILSGGNVATQTLRQRLMSISGIKDVVTLDYLTPKTMILVQMDMETVRGVVGMDMTTVSWESHGGFELNYKILCIMVPQIRADQNNNSGIVHGTHA